MQIPGYLEHQAALKAAGVEEVMVFCVNDGAVMTAWQKDQGADESLLTFYGDPSGALTKALGMVLDHPGPQGKGLFGRTKRFAAIVKMVWSKRWRSLKEQMTQRETTTPSRPARRRCSSILPNSPRASSKPIPSLGVCDVLAAMTCYISTWMWRRRRV